MVSLSLEEKDFREIIIWQFPFQENGYTVKFIRVVTSIKRSPVSSPVIENFIWIGPLLRSHLFYKATFTLSQSWPFNIGLTVLVFDNRCFSLLASQRLMTFRMLILYLHVTLFYLISSELITHISALKLVL